MFGWKNMNPLPFPSPERSETQILTLLEVTGMQSAFKSKIPQTSTAFGTVITLVKKRYVNNFGFCSKNNPKKQSDSLTLRLKILP